MSLQKHALVGSLLIGILGHLWTQNTTRAAAPSAHGAADFPAATQDAKKLQLSSEWKLDVWAADLQLANGVAFSFNLVSGTSRQETPPTLQWYVAESYRWANSIFDITQKTNWLLADMAFRNVGDRAAFLSREYATNLNVLTRDSEQIRLIEDRDGDHRADHSEVFADGYNSMVDGTAAGVLAQGTNVWFANIPNLSRHRTAGVPSEGPAAQSPSVPTLPQGNPSRETLATGFGVHIGVSGHDLHGLIRGPDGRIYVSIGDRGLSLTNREGIVIQLPDCGGVLRCEPDGRHLELFCHGLRNPQELAFDDLGNLWTVDNDTAGADPCRLLHLVEGADYGWRTSYQHMEGFGPWVQEQLWRGGQDGILPLAGTVSQGPSGLAYVPGSQFGSRFANTFLHCDFPGGVVAFTVQPVGASFTLGQKEKWLWNCWPTDVEFGPDGAVYVLDWVAGWGRPQKGRIYRVSPSASTSQEMKNFWSQTAHLLTAGVMSRQGTPELLEMLNHPDRRVRLEAQWELANRGPDSLPRLAETAHLSSSRFQRLHALWALQQLARTHLEASSDWDLAMARLLHLLGDPNRRLAAEAAVTLHEAGCTNVASQVQRLLSDPDYQVRLIASFSGVRSPKARPPRAWSRPLSELLNNRAEPWAKVLLSTLSTQTVVPSPLKRAQWLLADASDDRFLEHAAARILHAGFGLAEFQEKELLQAAADTNPPVRRAALIALRRIAERSLNGPGWPGAEQPMGRVGSIGTQWISFLTDPNPEVVIASARAIHDIPIVAGIPALASYITKIDCPTNLHSRVIDACFRLGTQQHAQMLAGFAARRDVPDASRVLALRALAEWEHPSPLDRVNGLWRPLVTIRKERVTNAVPPSATSNPLLARAAEVQAGRNLGRAAEIPSFPADLGRSVSYDEAITLRRNPAPAQRAFLRVAGELMDPSLPSEAGIILPGGESLPVQLAVVQTAVALKTKEASTPLYEKFLRPPTFPEVRRAIVPALVALKSAAASEVVRLAMTSPDPVLRASAVPHLDQLEGDEGVQLLNALAQDPQANLAARQAAWRQIGARLSAEPGSSTTLTPQSLHMLRDTLDQFLDGSLPAGLHLEVLQAAQSSRDPKVRQSLVRWTGQFQDFDFKEAGETKGGIKLDKRR